MYSNKIKVCADVHMCQNYYKYIKVTIDGFVKEVEVEKPLITVVSGDYFDRRISADDNIYTIAIDYLIQMAKNSKYLIVLQGTYSHDYDTLDVLEAIKKIQKNIIFVKSIMELELEEYKILCMPEAYPKDPSEYYGPYFKKNYDFIFGHGDIEGAVLHAGIDNTKLNGFKFSPSILSKMAKYVVFGHIHKHQFLKENVCYPGSLGRWNYGQEEEKGYIEIDLDLEVMKFKSLQAYVFDTVIINSEEDIERLKNELKKGNLDNNNIRIKIPENLKDMKKSFMDEEFVKELNNKFKFELIKEDVEDLDTLIYGEISKLSIPEQYFKMLEFEKEGKKIPAKMLKNYLTDEKFNEKIKEILFEVSNDKTLNQ